MKGLKYSLQMHHYATSSNHGFRIKKIVRFKTNLIVFATVYHFLRYITRVWSLTYDPLINYKYFSIVIF